MRKEQQGCTGCKGSEGNGLGGQRVLRAAGPASSHPSSPDLRSSVYASLRRDESASIPAHLRVVHRPTPPRGADLENKPTDTPNRAERTQRRLFRVLPLPPLSPPGRGCRAATGEGVPDRPAGERNGDWLRRGMLFAPEVPVPLSRSHSHRPCRANPSLASASSSKTNPFTGTPNRAERTQRRLFRVLPFSLRQRHLRIPGESSGMNADERRYGEGRDARDARDRRVKGWTAKGSANRQSCFFSSFFS